MTQLMRSDLRPLFNRTNSAHAGLLIQRGLTTWDTDSEKPTKKALIKKITSIQADELYLLAFKRWLATTKESDNNTFVNVSASIDGRLMTGLPLGGTLETGVTTHHTYGVPMIAGSSIKGAVRSYAEKTIEDKAVIEALFGADDDENPNAGYLIWHDAWWVPPVTNNHTLARDNNNKPFVADVVTVHHQSYYSGQLTEALDMENPVPNQQLAVQGGFYFVIEGVYAWVQYAKKLLEQALQEQGLGAKSGAGYGYFRVDPRLTEPHAQCIQKDLDIIINKTLSDEEKIINDFVKQLNELQTPWRGKPNQSCGFDQFYEAIMQWEDKAMLKKAHDVLIEQGKIWQGKSLTDNKKWRSKVQELRAKFQ